MARRGHEGRRDRWEKLAKQEDLEPKEAEVLQVIVVWRVRKERRASEVRREPRALLEIQVKASKGLTGPRASEVCQETQQKPGMVPRGPWDPGVSPA